MTDGVYTFEKVTNDGDDDTVLSPKNVLDIFGKHGEYILPFPAFISS